MNEELIENTQNTIVYQFFSYITCGYYLGWVLFGFYTGFHWFILAHFISEFCDTFRKQCILQGIIYWIFTSLFWIFRQTMLSWYIQCPNNISMSRDCLFNIQTTKYAIHYVIHIILLVWTFVFWFIDGIFLFIFLKKINYDIQSTSKLLLIKFILGSIITAIIVIIWSQVNWSI